MFIVLYALSILLAIIGFIELIPAVLQWIAYLIQALLGFLLANGPKPMSEVVADFPSHMMLPAFLYNWHGMLAAYASPVFLSTSIAVRLAGLKMQSLSERAEAKARSTKQSLLDKVAAEKQSLLDKVAADELRAKQLIDLVSTTSSLADLIPVHLKRAQVAIDLADGEFKDGLLDPFWDAVEKAITELAKIDALMRTIAQAVETYKLEAKYVAANKRDVPTLSVEIDALPSSLETSARLSACIREAQKRADYSTIFHLRRTNRILVAGFSTVGQAIYDLGARLEASISQVFQAVGDLNTTFRNDLGDVVYEFREARAFAEVADSGQRARDDKSVDILDNIQRGRRPTGHDWKPGTTKLK